MIINTVDVSGDERFVRYNNWRCCAPSSDLPGLKTGLPHLPTKPWSEDGVPRLSRSEDRAGGWKMGQGQKMGVSNSEYLFQKYFSET